MRSTVLLFVVALAGCVTPYKIEVKTPGQLAGKAGHLSNPTLTSRTIAFEFTNDSPQTSKILLDESAIIFQDGEVSGLARKSDVGLNTIRSGPEVIPAGFTAKLELIPVSRVLQSFLGFAFGASEIISCNHNRGGQCYADMNFGKTVSILLTVENNNQKHEYRIDNVILPNSY